MFIRHAYKHLVLCSVILFLVNAAADISIDYYFGNDEPLRTYGHCRTIEMVTICLQKCGPVHACVLGHCLCARSSTRGGGKGLPQKEDLSQEEENTAAESYEDDFEDDEDGIPISHRPSYIKEVISKPIRRHHIAHFCPNLKIARVCIRRCMKLGKPAFCGKDHICYCGHRYGYPAKDPKKENGENQFYDLYLKYFGPNPAWSKYKDSDLNESR